MRSSSLLSEIEAKCHTSSGGFAIRSSGQEEESRTQTRTALWFKHSVAKPFSVVRFGSTVLLWGIRLVLLACGLHPPSGVHLTLEKGTVMEHESKTTSARKNALLLIVTGALLLPVQFAGASVTQQSDVAPANAGGSSASGGRTASGGASVHDSSTQELGSGGMGSGGRPASGGTGGVVTVR